VFGIKLKPLIVHSSLDVNIVLAHSWILALQYLWSYSVNKIFRFFSTNTGFSIFFQLCEIWCDIFIIQTFLFGVRKINVPFPEKFLLCIFNIFQGELTCFLVSIFCILRKMAVTMENLVDITTVNILLMMVFDLLEFYFKIIWLLLRKDWSALRGYTSWKWWSWVWLVRLGCWTWI